MYVRKAIENLLQHKDIKRSSHHELKLACEEALKALEAAAPQTNNNQPSGPVTGKGIPFVCLFCLSDKGYHVFKKGLATGLIPHI